jgi:hypothetical protein
MYPQPVVSAAPSLSLQSLAQASRAVRRNRDGNIGTGAPGALRGRAEPRGPQLLRGGGLRIVATDQGKERRDQGAVVVQEGLPPREYAGRATLSRVPSSTTRACSGRPN